MSTESALRSAPHYGATPLEWNVLSCPDFGLGLGPDLLPVVSDPGARISPESSLKNIGKTPSTLNSAGEVIGFPRWTEHRANEIEIARWRRVPSYGICLQTRHVRAIDVDVTDEAEAAAISAAIEDELFESPPRRTRANSSKFLALVITPGPLAKRIIRTKSGGAIELLADGQQCVVAGTHPSGARYEWNGAALIPRHVSLMELDRLWTRLTRDFSVDGRSETASPVSRQQKALAAAHTDPVAAFLDEQGLVRGRASDGKLYVTCPFADEHSGDSGITETTYFPAHTGGFVRGHWHCLHAHCAARADAEFLAAVGYAADDAFEGLRGDVRAEMESASPQTIFLPGDYLPAPKAAARMFTILGGARELFRRGTTVVEVAEGRLQAVSPTAFRSRLSAAGRSVRAFKQDTHGGLVSHEKQPSEDQAKLLLATLEVSLLPPISLVTKSPLLVDDFGQLAAALPGYNDAAGGVYVSGHVVPVPVPLEEAVRRLSTLLNDFQFAAPGDRSRALASLVAPALRMGRLVQGDALITTVEADASQTGKGYLVALARAIYGEDSYTVVKRTGGVGSLDESLSQALLSGAPFVALDNIRGRVDSQLLESAVTAGQEAVSIRVPHRPEMSVDIRGVTFQATSNGIEGTTDLANRVLLVRLRKQPAGYKFSSFDEGDLLAHVRAQQAFYLGCVHAVVRGWDAAGRKRLPATHSFRAWVGALDWIAQKLFGAAALMDGHDALTTRLADPNLSWLRLVAVEVLRLKKGGAALSASELFDIAEDASIPIPGAHHTMPSDQGARKVGAILGRCFRETETLALDGIRVVRTDPDAWEESRARHFYSFTTAGE